MGNPKAFLTIPRKEAGYRPIHDRILDFSEVEQTLNSNDRRQQASRCMDCGVPFCHWACPLGNKAPEWNDALYKGDWEQAYRLLNSTNDFPEFTGRICPALCEKACVLNLMDHEPTTNREDECAIVEHAFSEDYVHVEIPERNGKTVAVIGAGPAGLVAANQLNHMGYKVTVFEARENAGGLLRYGIPNFKLNKSIIDRRLRLLEEEGIEFRYNQHIDVTKLPEGFDAYVVSTGTPTARDLKIPGRELKGVYFALELLSQQNRILAGMEFSKDELVNCKGKDVLVIGGGDTGSDCIGTAHRQGCDSLMTAIWHDTGEGGTAPDIDCVVKFKSEDGKLHEEHRPLLQLAHSNDDYSHHEVQKIVSLDDEYGNRSYVFFLSAKVGSNEYAHDIVAFEVAGDSLRPLYNYTIK